MTDEQQARLTKPYKEHLRESLKTTEDYVGYLSACHDEGPDTFALAVQDVLGFVATSMRSACIEKVKAVPIGGDANDAWAFRKRIIATLELLSAEDGR